MSHTERILESVKSAEVKAAVMKQRNSDMPVLFTGHVPATNFDTVYELMERTPRWDQLNGNLRKKPYDVVSARLFNPDVAQGYSRDSDVLAPMVTKIYRELRKTGIVVTTQTHVSKNEQDRETYRAYVAVPTLEPGIDSEGQHCVRRDGWSQDVFMGYLLSREDDKGRPLATIGQVAESFGYNALMDALQPEVTTVLKNKLKLDVQHAVSQQVQEDTQTGARLAAYMMTHGRLLPEQVEEQFGAEVLEKACQPQTVKWLTSLRGLPGGSLEQEMPLAAKYLMQKKLRNSVESNTR